MADCLYFCRLFLSVFIIQCRLFWSSSRSGWHCCVCQAVHLWLMGPKKPGHKESTLTFSDCMNVIYIASLVNLNTLYTYTLADDVSFTICCTPPPPASHLPFINTLSVCKITTSIFISVCTDSWQLIKLIRGKYSLKCSIQTGPFLYYMIKTVCPVYSIIHGIVVCSSFCSLSITRSIFVHVVFPNGC